MRSRILVVVAVCFLVGCASSGGEKASQGDSALMGIDAGPKSAVWQDWTPRTTRGLVPEGFKAKVHAFDYWQIGDDQVVERAWSGMAAVLDYLRREGLGERQKRTATVLLQALDGRADDGRPRMDATFVVSADAEQSTEGVVVRLFRQLPDQVTPGIALYLERREGQGLGFGRAILWAEPAFEQAQPFTLRLEKTEQVDWVAHKFDGLRYPLSDVARGSLEGVAELSRDIFTRHFWKPFVGPAFVEAKSRAAEFEPIAEGPKPALGMDLKERTIEQVYRNTVFPPRMDAIQLPKPHAEEGAGAGE